MFISPFSVHWLKQAKKLLGYWGKDCVYPEEIWTILAELLYHDPLQAQDTAAILMYTWVENATSFGIVILLIKQTFGPLE